MFSHRQNVDRRAFAFPAAAHAAATLIVSLILGGAAIAGVDHVAGPVAVEVESVHDGDTFTVMAHIWPGHYVRTSVRLRGVDTPERRGHCADERARAEAARRFTEAFLRDGAPITLRDVQPDKYGGRVDALVFNARGASLADALVSRGLARHYDGGKRAPWCAG